MADVECGFTDKDGKTGVEHLIFFGPTLKVDIGFDQNYSPTAGGFPDLALKQMDALVDTGATESCIDSSLAMQLQLPIVDRRNVSGVHGAFEVNMHLAHIYVPSLKFTIHGIFAGVNLIAGGQPHHALIGRTFLRHTTMTYNGLTGRVTISKA